MKCMIWDITKCCRRSYLVVVHENQNIYWLAAFKQSICLLEEHLVESRKVIMVYGKKKCTTNVTRQLERRSIPFGFSCFSNGLFEVPGITMTVLLSPPQWRVCARDLKRPRGSIDMTSANSLLTCYTGWDGRLWVFKLCTATGLSRGRRTSDGGALRLCHVMEGCWANLVTLEAESVD